MMRKKGLWFGLLILLLLWPASAIFADEPGLYLDGGRIFVDEDVSLEPGETFRGDLGVFNGDLTVPQGAVVEGDVFVTNGDAEIAGRVNGDLAVISGDLDIARTGQVRRDAFVMSGDLDVAGRVEGDAAALFGGIVLRSSAVVEGDVLVLSGNLERETGAQVYGQAMPELRLPDLPFLPEMPAVPEMPEMPAVPAVPQIPATPRLPDVPTPPRFQPEPVGNPVGRFFGRVLTAGFFSVLFIAVGVLLVFAWPRQTKRVADCIATLPVQSFGLGLLTFLLAAVLEALAMVLMIVVILVAAAFISTVILIPIGLLLILLSVLVLLPVPLALAGAMVMGWVSLAQLVGRKAVKVLNAGYVQPLGATLVGLLITVPLAALLWIIKPVCCAWPFIILLTSVGLGAVFHTRFGRQSCSQPQPAAGHELLPAEAMDEEIGLPDNADNGPQASP